MEQLARKTVQLELGEDVVAVLETVASKQGLDTEEVATEAILLWVEQYRKYGPAFSRSPAA